MPVSEYLEDKSIAEFLSEVRESCRQIQKKYSPFITLPNKFEPPKKGKLFGLPVSVKDCICTKGLRTTAGSKILSNYVPPFNSTAVERIKKAGGVIIGKTTQDEFGFGTFSTNCAYEIPKNPYDPQRSCGGSSGGAACLVSAADFPHIALAESTGGSISCPASFTGTVGLTPTYGRVSRWGLISYSNSMDKIGPIGKSVYDVALMLSIISGYDPKDPTSLKTKKQDFRKYLKAEVKGVKLGVPKEYFGEGVDEEIKKLVWKGIKRLESLGATYEEISLPYTKYSLPAFYIIALSEASTNLAKFCGMRYGLHKKLEGNFVEYFSKVRAVGFGEEAKRRIILGTFARMAGFRKKYYLKALKVRTKIIRDFKKAFKEFEVLAAPTMPVIAPRFDQIERLEPIQQYMMDILTVAPNLAGIPMISIPCGFVKGLPVGLHLMGNHLEEGKILQVAYTFEQNEKNEG